MLLLLLFINLSFIVIDGWNIPVSQPQQGVILHLFTECIQSQQCSHIVIKCPSFLVWGDSREGKTINVVT